MIHEQKKALSCLPILPPVDLSTITGRRMNAGKGGEEPEC